MTCSSLGYLVSTSVPFFRFEQQAHEYTLALSSQTSNEAREMVEIMYNLKVLALQPCEYYPNAIHYNIFQLCKDNFAVRKEYLNRFRSIFDRSIQDPVKKVVLRDGDQCALPVSIMHPTLAKLAHRMKVLDEDVRTAYVPNGNQVSLRTGKSMLLDRALVNSSRIFYQSLYELCQAEGNKIVNVLDAFLTSFLGEEQDGYGRQGSNLADATWSVFPHDDRTLRFHLVIAKSKSNEHSLGDASLQGAYWYETNMHFLKVCSCVFFSAYRC